MREVIVSNLVSLDGFIAGPQGELDWFVVDQEFDAYARELFAGVDTLLFGRVTYDLMASFWPTPAADAEDPFITERMNGLTKVVFSRTLERVEWQNTRLVKGNPAGEVTRLKGEPGGNLMIFGSGTLVSALAPLGLIDEYRIVVNPVILGRGQPLFRGIGESIPLALTGTRTLGCGDVILCYRHIHGREG
jgi:dihydrofolate reductase